VGLPTLAYSFLFVAFPAKAWLLDCLSLVCHWLYKGYRGHNKNEVPPTICCLQETHLIDRNKHRLRMKVWKKIYQANGPRKQAGVAILISAKVDFKPTLIK
jgi:hypothetical protein